MNAYRGIFVGNRLIDFIVDPIEIFAVVVNALTTVKRLRQTVLGLNRVTRHSKVSMIRVHILSARHVFAAVFLNRLIGFPSLAHRRIARLFKEDTYVKRITLVIWTTARLPRFPIRGTLFRYTPEGFSFWNTEHFSTDLHIFLGNIR